jgi:hypothetical protein
MCHPLLGDSGNSLLTFKEKRKDYLEIGKRSEHYFDEANCHLLN